MWEEPTVPDDDWWLAALGDCHGNEEFTFVHRDMQRVVHELRDIFLDINFWDAGNCRWVTWMQIKPTSWHIHIIFEDVGSHDAFVGYGADVDTVLVIVCCDVL